MLFPSTQELKSSLAEQSKRVCGPGLFAVLAFTPRKADAHFALYTPDDQVPVDLDVSSSRWFPCGLAGLPSASTRGVTPNEPSPAMQPPSDNERARVLYEEGLRAQEQGDESHADDLFGRVQTDFPASPYAALAAHNLQDARKPRPRRGFTIGLGVDLGTPPRPFQRQR